MQNWSGTARKLVIGFGALVVTIALASFLTLAGLGRIHRAIELTKHERRTNRSIVALLVGAPLLAAAITFHVGRSIAKPIARLSRGAERLAAGDLDTKIDIPDHDEFGALARQFNAMTASLKRCAGTRRDRHHHRGRRRRRRTSLEDQAGRGVTLKLPRHEEAR